MKKSIRSLIAMIAAFCIAFTCIPMMAGNLGVSAAAKLPSKIKLTADSDSQTDALLRWNKIKKPDKGYAVFRNGVPVAHLSKNRKIFSDTGLSAGTSYSYQIKTYKIKKVKKWFNKNTGKWQKKKPARKYCGKSKKVKTYIYKKSSNIVHITTRGDHSYYDESDDTSVHENSSPDTFDSSFASFILEDMTLNINSWAWLYVSSQKEATWTSSDTSVATVERYDKLNWQVHAHAQGTAILTATNWDGQTKTMKVSVEDPDAWKTEYPGYDFSKEQKLNVPVEFVEGKTYTLSVDAPPESAQNVCWALSDMSLIKSKSDDGLSITLEIPYKNKQKSIFIDAINRRNEDNSIIWASESKTVSIVADPDKEVTFFNRHVSCSILDLDHIVISSAARDEKGNATIDITFVSDGGKNCLEDKLHFTIEDVTPNAYNRVFTDLGCSTHLSSSYSVEQKLEFVKENDEYTCQSRSTVTYTIKAGPAVRAIKVQEHSGLCNEIIYCIPTDKESYDKYYPYIDKLYDEVRHKIESQLWSDDMTTDEKLTAIENYINKTTHYPGACTSKEVNPTLWKDWAVDDYMLLYDMVDEVRLNAIMKFQGGISSCVAAYQLGDVAEEDLGLEYIYDKDSDTVLEKEGFWYGVGDYSTNPSAPGHITLYYKGPDLSVTAHDVQGLMVFTDCTEHNCHRHLLPLN